MSKFNYDEFLEEQRSLKESWRTYLTSEDDDFHRGYNSGYFDALDDLVTDREEHNYGE
jgi:hypothetical protein